MFVQIFFFVFRKFNDIIEKMFESLRLGIGLFFLFLVVCVLLWFLRTIPTTKDIQKKWDTTTRESPHQTTHRHAHTHKNIVHAISSTHEAKKRSMEENAL